jgi:hypothetical protein
MFEFAWPTPRQGVVETLNLVERLRLVDGFSDRTIRGALRDAGDPEEGFTQWADYLAAVERFAEARASYGRRAA